MAEPEESFATSEDELREVTLVGNSTVSCASDEFVYSIFKCLHLNKFEFQVFNESLLRELKEEPFEEFLSASELLEIKVQ